MKKRIILIVICLIVIFVSIKLVDKIIYESKVHKLNTAIHTGDYNELKKLFGNRYSDSEIKNLILWTKNNPKETNEQLKLLKNNVKRFNGEFDNKNLQPSALAYIEPEPFIMLTKDGFFDYSFEFKKQTLHFTFDKNNYKVYLNGNLVDLKVKDEEYGLYNYEVIPNYYKITIKDTDSVIIYSDKVYPYSNIDLISIHIPEITPGW